MRWNFLFLSCLVALSSAFYVQYDTHSFLSLPVKKLIGVYDYHRKIGIPLARKIREREYRTSRIIDGALTEIGIIPYQAGLITTVLNEQQSVCGGSLISKNRVLTAAHCCQDGVVTAESVTVVLGSSQLFYGGLRVDTTGAIVHTEYDPKIATNDIAILKTPNVQTTLLIQVIALPWDTNLYKDLIGFDTVASGYGLTTDKDKIEQYQSVSAVTVPVISNAECKVEYGDVIKKQHVCTSGVGKRGTCKGDSGGPLVVKIRTKPVLIGITSFGSNSCETSSPSVFVRVTEFLPWIAHVLKDH